MKRTNLLAWLCGLAFLLQSCEWCPAAFFGSGVTASPWVKTNLLTQTNAAGVAAAIGVSNATNVFNITNTYNVTNLYLVTNTALVGDAAALTNLSAPHLVGPVPDGSLSNNVVRGTFVLTSGMVSNGSGGFTVAGTVNAIIVSNPLDSEDNPLITWTGTEWHVSPQGGIAAVWRWLKFEPQ